MKNNKKYINQNGEIIEGKDSTIRNNQHFNSSDNIDNKDNKKHLLLNDKILSSISYNNYVPLEKLKGINKKIFLYSIDYANNKAIFKIVGLEKIVNANIITKIVSIDREGNIKGYSKLFAIYALGLGFINANLVKYGKDTLISNYSIDIKKLNDSINNPKVNLLCSIDIFTKDYFNDIIGKDVVVNKLVAIPNNQAYKKIVLDYLAFIKDN